VVSLNELNIIEEILWKRGGVKCRKIERRVWSTQKF